jgi:hypothetical protein
LFRLSHRKLDQLAAEAIVSAEKICLYDRPVLLLDRDTRPGQCYHIHALLLITC